MGLPWICANKLIHRSAEYAEHYLLGSMQAGVFDVARAEGGTRLFEMRVIGWVLMVENRRKKIEGAGTLRSLRPLSIVPRSF
jgi:hypothetical protein